MKFSRILLLSALVLGLAAPAAFANTHVSLVGTSNYDMATYTVDAATAAGTDAAFAKKFAFPGGGILLDFGMSQHLSFEIGGLYNTRKVDLKITTPIVLTDTVAMSSVQVPMVFRFWLNHMISLGVGGYVESAMGKVKTTSSDATILPDSEKTYTDEKIKNLDYGVIGSLNFIFPLGSSLGLVVDGRYALGLRELSTDDATTYKHKDIQGLVGIRFGGMK